jgi:hypothetical protein
MVANSHRVKATLRFMLERLCTTRTDSTNPEPFSGIGKARAIRAPLAVLFVASLILALAAVQQAQATVIVPSRDRIAYNAPPGTRNDLRRPRQP